VFADDVADDASRDRVDEHGVAEGRRHDFHGCSADRIPQRPVQQTAESLLGRRCFHERLAVVEHANEKEDRSQKLVEVSRRLGEAPRLEEVDEGLGEEPALPDGRDEAGISANARAGSLAARIAIHLKRQIVSQVLRYCREFSQRHVLHEAGYGVILADNDAQCGAMR